MPAPAATPGAAASVTSASEAEQLFRHVSNVLDALSKLIQQETDLVRVGRLAEARQLEKSKGDLAGSYVAGAMRMRGSQGYLKRVLGPERLGVLRRSHEAFRTLIQTNMTVLATAHSVSEGIIRGLSQELSRKSTPQTYGANGRASVARYAPAAPLAISRKL